MPHSVQAVTFDLWQTLMHDSKEQAVKRGLLRVERIHQALASAGQALPRETVDETVQAIWTVWRATYWDRHNDPGFDAQIVWLRDRLGIPEGNHRLIQELRHAYVDAIFAAPPELDADAIPALTQLQARGLRLGLICNTSVTPGFALRRLLAGWRLDRLLSVQLFSDETGLRKPAPEVFCEAARQLGIGIEAMLHVGDNPEADVQGALSAGAAALLVGPDVPLRQVVSTIKTT